MTDDTTTEPSDLKHYAIFMTHTSYDLVGPFEDEAALDVWGEIESGSNWQSVKLPDNFVPDLHEPDLNSELGFTEASIPVTSSPMSDDAKPYVLWIRDDEFFLIGPFKSHAALGAWADAWEEDKYDCDPRWNPLDLAGDLRPQVRGPDWHPPADYMKSYIIMTTDTAWLVGPFADLDAAGEWALANVDEHTPGWRDWQAVELGDAALSLHAPTDPKAVVGPAATPAAA